MSRHIETRRYLKSIATRDGFKEILDNVVMTSEERTILVMHYIDGRSLMAIAEALGYSESTIKRKHRSILQRVGKTL